HIRTLSKAITLLYREQKKSLKHLRDGRFKNLVRELLWAATEDKIVKGKNGKDEISFRKFKGQTYWTKKAFNLYTNNGSVKGLQHEHVISKKEFINAFEKNSSEKILKNF